MSKATAGQIQSELTEIFKEYAVSTGYYAEEELEYYDFGSGLFGAYEEAGEPFETTFGPVTVVEDIGGGEGDGETRFVVFQLDNTDGYTQFFRADGYYASWDGSNWDDSDLYEVVPQPVQKVEYVRATQ